MAERDALLQLCRCYGIAPDYYDIWGTHHDVSTASLLALLDAMGVRIDAKHSIEAAVAAAERSRWRSVLPGALVLRAQAPRPIRLRLSAAKGARAIAWRVTEENGGGHEGTFDPSSLPCAERAEIAGERFCAREFALPIDLPCGYHRLALSQAGATLGEALLVVAPPRCYRPPALEAGVRVWGAAAQLYSVRSARNWGMGDFADLAAIARQWGAAGAAIVGVNPLHALYPHNPEHASPYSPSSRCFLNVLYLDIEALEDFSGCAEALALAASPGFQADLQRLRAAELVDYAGVAAAKFAVLYHCYVHFRSRHLASETPRARDFRAFQAEGGPLLARQALFEALQERFHRRDPAIWGWPVWPEPYRDPDSTEVARFARKQVQRVEFYQYLQWQADRQLAVVGTQCTRFGLSVGLYRDLAVSIDRGGGEAWANQDLYAVTASIGAPPDDFNLRGQDWGLLPLVPEQLRAAAYAPFIATLRANMRHAAALRIDHVMGLARLFWVPPGGKPRDGAYVQYPFEDLLGIVALESQRNRCLVIGEALGTVPDEVRHALTREGILSYRVLYFERGHSGEFKAPAEYPADALVTVSTHDLPTVAGYWEGLDLALRHTLVLKTSEEVRWTKLSERARELVRLLAALEREGLLPDGVSAGPDSLPGMSPELMRALHRFLARSPAQVLVAQLEDVLGVREQANLPGTTSEHPNWRRRLPLALERWPEDERFLDLVRALERERPGASKNPEKAIQ
ncbi:MAG: 4-alpha-glucanotransferase [Betaproteobacteria bacterium]|nr:4-alpha-glucanotransferase [Betaproteobacteria bacterium]